jgi:hypothetical protein
VRLAREYAPIVPLAGLIASPDTPPSPSAKVRVFGQLDAAEKRFAALTVPR